MLVRRLLAALALTLGLGLLAQPAAAQAPLPGGVSAPAAAPAAAPPQATVAAVSPDYKLGPNDKVRIIVFGEETLSGEFFVSGAGKISLPLIGEQQAANMTPRELQTEIETALRQGYLKEPRVSAEVLNYRPFYILGEVNKPGEYPYTNGLNVLNAVATAGGFTYRAQNKKVFIRRANEAKEESYPLTSDLVVSPGDTIRVGERFF